MPILGPGGGAAERKSAKGKKKVKKAARRKTAKPTHQQAATGGRPAEKTPGAETAYPKTVWISSKDGTRAKGFLEDRAAAYLPDQNVLQINRDFSVFADTIEYCGRGLALGREHAEGCPRHGAFLL